MSSAASEMSVLKQGSGSSCGIPPRKHPQPPTTQEIIMIDSDDESDDNDDAGEVTIPDAKPNDSLSSRALAFRSARDHNSVASSTINGVLPKTHHANSNSSHHKTFRIPTIRPDMKAHYLSVPAVKDSLMNPRYSSSPAAPGSARTPKSVLAVKNRSSSSIGTREAGQEKLDTYIKPVTLQASQSTSTIAPSTSTKATPAFASAALKKWENFMSSRPLTQRTPDEAEQLEMPRPSGQQQNDNEPITAPACRTSSGRKPPPVRVKQEPGSSSHNSSNFKNVLPPRTPLKPAASNRKGAAPSVPSSAGTSFYDPYNISSDSESDDDEEVNGKVSSCGLRSFSEINSSPSNNAAMGLQEAEQVLSSPWTENFRERELSVEAVLRECQHALLDDSPIPISITSSSGQARQARVERTRSSRTQTRPQAQIQDQNSSRKRPCLSRDRDEIIPATPSPVKRIVSFVLVENEDDKHKRVEGDDQGTIIVKAEHASVDKLGNKRERTQSHGEKTATRHRNHDRKAWHAKQKRKRERKTSGGGPKFVKQEE